MRIEINKIVTEDKNADVLSVKPELICLDDIKSVRRWHKKSAGEMLLKADIIVLSMRDGSKDIKVNESYDSFIGRIGSDNVIRLNESN